MCFEKLGPNRKWAEKHTESHEWYRKMARRCGMPEAKINAALKEDPVVPNDPLNRLMGPYVVENFNKKISELKGNKRKRT